MFFNILLLIIYYISFLVRIPQEVQVKEKFITDSISTPDSAGKGIVGDTLVLIESSGSDEALDALRLEKFITSITDTDGGQPLVEDAVLSMDSNQELVRTRLPFSTTSTTTITSTTAAYYYYHYHHYYHHYYFYYHHYYYFYHHPHYYYCCCCCFQ